MSATALATLSRRFICKGAAWEVINSNLVKERSLFLFNDVLVVAKEMKSLDSGVDNQVMQTFFQIKSVVNLREMSLKLDRNENPQDAFLSTPLMARASVRFEKNPKQGVKYLIDHHVITSNPRSVAEFMYRTPSLSKPSIGKFISDPANEDYLEAYCNCYDFVGLRIDQSLRLFFYGFRPPGDAQAMDTVLAAFARKYFRDNSTTLSSHEVALKLVFALLMVNAEMHRKDAEVQDEYGIVVPKLAPEDFIDRFRMHDPEGEVPDEDLLDMYDSMTEEKLCVPPKREEDESSLLQVKFSKFPYRITVRKTSVQVTVSIPRPDPGLQLRVFCHQGLTCQPDLLTFRNSHEATFTLTGTSLGRKGVSFVKLGPSARKYGMSCLPQGQTVIVEPPFMRHVFQVKSKKRDPRMNRRIGYMFSVATEEQRENWVQQLQSVTEALDGGNEVTYGCPSDDPFFQSIIQDFSTPESGAVVVPSAKNLQFNM
jgi:hypothetical protein